MKPIDFKASLNNIRSTLFLYPISVPRSLYNLHRIVNVANTASRLLTSQGNHVCCQGSGMTVVTKHGRESESRVIYYS